VPGSTTPIVRGTKHIRARRGDHPAREPGTVTTFVALLMGVAVTRDEKTRARKPGTKYLLGGRISFSIGMGLNDTVLGFQ